MYRREAVYSSRMTAATAVYKRKWRMWSTLYDGARDFLMFTVSGTPVNGPDGLLCAATVRNIK